MKIEEALDYLNDPIGKSLEVHFEALKVARETLEKQIPKKPKYFIDMYGHNRPGCPSCPRSEILYAGQSFCCVCGTKIDWGKEE